MDKMFGKYGDIKYPVLLPMLASDSKSVADELATVLSKSSDADALILIDRETVEALRALLNTNAVVMSKLSKEHEALIESIDRLALLVESEKRERERYPSK